MKCLAFYHLGIAVGRLWEIHDRYHLQGEALPTAVIQALIGEAKAALEHANQLLGEGEGRGREASEEAAGGSAH